MKPYTLLVLGLLFGSPQTNAQQPPKTRAENPYKLQLPGQADYQLVSTALSVQARQANQQMPISPELKAMPHASEIETAARANNLDPALVHALIHVESRHNSNALSNKGAMGLMQVLPETAQRFGVNNPSSTQANLNAGTRYLRSLLDLFDQRLDLALAAYNAGEGAVLRHKNQIPPYRETQLYVPAVLNKYDEWQVPKSKEAFYLPGTLLDRKAVARFRNDTGNEDGADALASPK
jgi:soluble lytic murein transglycosylase-like protein